MSQLTGYIFFIVLAVVILLSAFYKSFRVTRSVDDFVAAGRNSGLGILSASILSSWVWTLTLMGSSEAGMWFGVTGGIHYAWGAVIPFFIFISISLRLRRIMPKASTFSEFIYERFGKVLHIIFLLFGILVSLYVFTEQLVGAGLLFNTTFGIPFKNGVILTAILVTIYISFCGLRGSLFTDLLQFLVIAVGCLILIPWLLVEIGGISFLYDGLEKVVEDPQNINHNKNALSFCSLSGFRYGIAVLVIALGQVMFEQGYHQRAIAAKDSKTLKKAYLIGGVFAWLAIPLCFGTIVGGAGLALGLGEGVGINSTSEVSPYIFTEILGPIGGLMFACMTFVAATSTADTSLSGIQSLLTADFYEKLKKENDEVKQIKFGRISTVLVSLLGIFAALSLEGVSLLKIDIFGGILFATPVAAFIFGLYSEKTSKNIALISICAGLICGIGAWNIIEDEELNWFIGNLIALILPILIISVSLLFSKQKFNFKKLKDYNPKHIVELT